MKTIPFWTDLTPPPENLSSPRIPEAVDVLVIGAGYSGLNTALVLAKSGASVAVLERHNIGWGASSRNGGLATTGMKRSISSIIKRYGEELGRFFWQSSLDAVDLIENLVNQEGVDCDYARSGSLALAWKPSHYEQMVAKAKWMDDKLGHKVSLVPKADLRSEIGTDAFYGATLDEASAGLNPAKYVFELARVAVGYGAIICEHSPVTKIVKHDGGFQVHTTQGVVSSKEVVVATNGYTDKLVPQLKPKVFPVGSYIIVTEPLSPELQQELSPKLRMFYDTKWFLNYFRLTADGRMLFGGRNNLSTDLDIVESSHRLREQMLYVFPQLRDIPITHSWTGQLGITFDLMPHIGEADGIHYVFGYGGHGVPIATYLGTEMGMLLTGQKTSSPFVDISHQTMFFYRNKPWFLPLAAAYFRTLDMLT